MNPRIVAATFLITGTVVAGALAGCASRTDDSSSNFTNWLRTDHDLSKFAQVDGSYELTFPRDHGAHNDFFTEWWYVTSILHTDEGREFGVQFTIFRQAVSNSIEGSENWRTGQVYMGHLALSDVVNRHHYDDERLSREHPKLAGARSDPFTVFVENWELTSQGESFLPLQLNAKNSEVVIELVLEEGKPIVLHGESGFSRKSPEHASYYYSIPRIRTRGNLSIGTSEYEIEGISWLDREWSSGLLGRQYSGWYWFALSFDDGSDVVLFSLRDLKDGFTSDRVGRWIDGEGESTALATENWEISPIRTWKQWPVEWELILKQQKFRIAAKFDDQEMNTSIPYWEGIVDIAQNGESVGSGYMELTGY